MIVSTLAAFLQAAPMTPVLPADKDTAEAVPLTAPMLLRGAMTADDYPISARKADQTGAVLVSFLVTRDGDASGCRVERSSGVQVLDEATCRIVDERYVLEPPRDADGQAVETRLLHTVRWELL